MIEILKQQFSQDAPAEEKINRIREFLQIISLKIIYDKNLFNNLAFVGGTALRFLFDLKRFSEDLDFSLINKKGYNFSKVNSIILDGLKLYGLNVDSKSSDRNNVHNAWLKFTGLLKAVGLSNLEEQKLSIKIEIDTNPPNGWHIENTIVNKTYIFNIVHFDLPSLYATKLHACFYRKFIKGRDFYDLVWYISKKIKPNLVLLNDAIKQTEGRTPNINEENFKEFLLEKVKKINFADVKKDVDRFIEDKNELKFLESRIIQQTIKSL